MTITTEELPFYETVKMYLDKLEHFSGNEWRVAITSEWAMAIEENKEFMNCDHWWTHTDGAITDETLFEDLKAVLAEVCERSQHG